MSRAKNLTLQRAANVKFCPMQHFSLLSPDFAIDVLSYLHCVGLFRAPSCYNSILLACGVSVFLMFFFFVVVVVVFSWNDKAERLALDFVTGRIYLTDAGQFSVSFFDPVSNQTNIVIVGSIVDQPRDIVLDPTSR